MENTHGVWKAHPKMNQKMFDSLPIEGILEDVLNCVLARITLGDMGNINFIQRYLLQKLSMARFNRRYKKVDGEYKSKYYLVNECIDNNHKHFYNKRVYLEPSNN